MRTTDCMHRLYELTRGFRLRIALCSVTGVIGVCVSLFFIAVCKHLVDIATGKSDDNLTLFMVLMPVCMLLQLCLSYVMNWLISLNTISLKNMIRHCLFVRLMNSNLTVKDSFHTGDIINRMEEDTSVVTDTLCSSLPNTLVTLFQLVAAFCFLLILEPMLAWILLIIMPIAILSSKVYMMRMRELTKGIRTLDSKIQTHVQEHLQHRILLRSMEYIGESANTLSSMQTGLRRETMQRTSFSLFSRTAVGLGFATGYAIAFLWGITGLRSGAVTFGMMTAFLQLVAQVQRPIVALSQQVPAFVQTLTSVERLEELNNIPQDKDGEPIQLNGELGIKVENLGFSYSGTDKRVIKNFSHDFRPGTKTAIVGETGAGKSTLLHLILSLLTADSGKLSIYNNDKQIEVSSLIRCNMVYVPQGNTLMSGTIRDNLLLGNPNATQAQMEEALRIAAADFVLSLPNGIDTLCSEQGSGLSEGQAQRIAIARGLLRPGGVILLDEPTSALDSSTEALFMERISRLKDKTLIMVTHKESVSDMCDEVVRIL